jgi:hypothetical protein
LLLIEYAPPRIAKTPPRARGYLQRMHDPLVALITGANKGTGREIARQLAARGLTVLIGSRDPSRGQAAAAELGGSARAIALDVTDTASIAAAAAQIRRDLGRLDILVNNAGIPVGPTASPLSDWCRGRSSKPMVLRASGGAAGSIPVRFRHLSHKSKHARKARQPLEPGRLEPAESPPGESLLVVIVDHLAAAADHASLGVATGHVPYHAAGAVAPEL